MEKIAPKLIRINHDDYSAEYIGWTTDNRQFFLTTPFVPARGDNSGGEFLALYIFDANGVLLEAKIDDLGTREQMDDDFRCSLRDTRLADLGEISFGDIEIAPFSVKKFGIEFGLIANAPQEPDEDWWVTAEPGDYMAFYPPYDGDYDT